MLKGTAIEPPHDPPPALAPAAVPPDPPKHEWPKMPTYKLSRGSSTLKTDRRAKFSSAFHQCTSYDDWMNYQHYGFYEFDDPSQFIKTWRTFDIHTRAVKLEKAKFIWSSFYNVTVNSLQCNNELAKAAYSSASTLQKKAKLFYAKHPITSSTFRK